MTTIFCDEAGGKIMMIQYPVFFVCFLFGLLRVRDKVAVRLWCFKLFFLFVIEPRLYVVQTLVEQIDVSERLQMHDYLQQGTHWHF